MKKHLSLNPKQATVGNISDDIANNVAAIATNQGNIVNISHNIDALNVSFALNLIKYVIEDKQSTSAILDFQFE